MYKNYKVVVNTAAGRRRYMQYLIPYIVSSGIVDRYDIWINTHNGADIEFFKRVAELYPIVNLVWQPDGVVNGNKSINAFYKQCIEDNTIYFKLDDDIVWMEPNLIEKMVEFRLSNPEYFLVSPLVINNSLSTYLLQIEEKLNLREYCNADSSHPILWRSGRFAADLHDWFLTNYLLQNKWDSLHIGIKPMGITRFSINSILWFGNDMRAFNGEVPGDDEEYLSSIYPAKQGLANAWNGDAIVAHFAFFTQREELDRMGILERYGDYSFNEWAKDPIMKRISNSIRKIMSEIDQDIKELESRPSPYRKVVAKPTLRSKIKRIIPKFIIAIRDHIKTKDADINFIR